MNKGNKKYLIPTLISVAFLFVWIFVTVYLTNGRDFSDFTVADSRIFSGFVIVECFTLASIVFFLIKMQQNTKKNADTQNAVHTPVDKRRLAISILSFITIILVMVGGILTKPHVPAAFENVIGVTAVTTLLLPVLFLIVNVIVHAIYVKKFNKKSVAEMQQYWYSQRTTPEETVDKKLRLLKSVIWFNDIYCVLLTVCALVSTYCCGMIYEGGSIISLVWISYLTLLGAALRIRLKPSKKVFSEDERYVSENDYPILYGLARKASSATGCVSDIRIAVTNDFNAGAADINGITSIQLGALLLNALSEDELYCVLLHEFSHIKSENKRKKIHNYYAAQLDYNAGLTKYLFTFVDRYFHVHYGLYVYAASLLREKDADRAMMIAGNNEIAASALVKIKYYELYSWEKGTYDTPCDMESEQYDTDSLKKELQNFKIASQNHAGKWNALINNEILSRSASHPVLKTRLEELGVSEPRALYLESSAAYTAECDKAMGFISSLIAEQYKDVYTQYREYGYLRPKELVDIWESNGKPIVAEDYRDICDALRQLGRNTEALEVCEQAIRLFDGAASCYAHFIKGCYLLHSFDEAGIDHVYNAIENNLNYLDEGLEWIGRFCCLMGQEDQLEVYRERAVLLAEKNRIHAQANVINRKDKLSSELLPEGMLEDILAHITSEHSEYIENIYLVRKTITEDFFTSVFVIEMSLDTDDDTRDDILHKAFNYLDTCSDWQFSLFDYENIENIRIEKIKGSCVYTKK